MADKEIKEGDQVSWQWSGSRPGGTVGEVKEQGKVEIETHRGNTVSKNAEPGNPAVKIERSGNDVVKKASELDVEKEGDKHKEAPGEEKTVSKDDEKKSDDKKSDDKKENGDSSEKKENGDAATGDKRKAEDTAEEKKSEEDGDAKKQKTDDAAKTNGDAAPKKKGRPAKGESGPKKETKKKEPKKAATESGEPRRSGRNASK